MDRRTLVQNSAVALGSLVVGGTQLAAATANGNAKASLLDDVLTTTKDCVGAGNVCVGCCIQMISDGKTDMSACNQAVHQMLATCNAMLQLAAQNAPLAKAMASVCADACSTCRDACDAQACCSDACRACRDACDACEAACRAYAAA